LLAQVPLVALMVAYTVAGLWVLAQQIKEELNTFKMEMEVHEMSKPYTHFF